MKKLLVIFAGFGLVLAGFIPRTSASNPHDTFSLFRNSLLSQNSPGFNGTLTSQSQSGDVSTIRGSGQETSKSGIVEPHQVIVKDTRDVPRLTNKQIRERQEAIEERRGEPIVPIAEGPTARAGTIDPPTPAPMMAAPGESSRVTSPLAPNDMVTFRQHDMTNTEAPNTDRSNILEPSVISVENAVFYTSNWFAARSVDGGQNFTYVNPYASFPSANGGFCCDQVTAYAPSHNMAIWGLQYSQDTAGGTFRIARAIGGAGIGSNAWTYYDFTPVSFAFPAGHWMDFPNLSVNAGNLYAASNVFTNAGVFAGNVVWRMSLDALAAGGLLSYSYFARTDINTIRLVDGAGSTMYWAAFLNTTTMRIHRWDDSSGAIMWDDIALNAFTYLSRDGVSNTADGRNWAARGDSRPLGAYVANGIIGVFWMAKQDGTFPQPYSIHARFNQSTRALVTQQAIWNPTFAWLYPNVAVNGAGNLGGVIAFGGGTGAQTTAFPHAAYWAIDDVNPGLPIGANFTGIIGNAGPVGNVWGDYLSVRRHSLYPNTWVAAVYALNGTTPVPRYLWFGRQRDLSVRVSDFDGDGLSDIGVFRPSAGTWYLSRSTAGFLGVGFGTSGDLSAPGDYDGDGKTDVAVFRPSTGTWYLLRSTLGFTAMAFGANGDEPAVGDFDNDGKADIGVFRPSTGSWYIQRSQQGFLGTAFGANGDNPAVGDYDGDGRADIAVFRPSTGIWYLQRSTLGFTGIGFGASGDKPVPGDYDGDNKTDVAVFRPSNGTWYVQRSMLGFTASAFGSNGDRPAPADYDNDLKTDYAVFRPTTGTWYIQRSNLGFYAQAFGTNGDVPTAGAYVP